MTITEFKISSDKVRLELTITDAASVSTLRLWTDKTYKDFTKAIDLSAKLTGSATEYISISLAEISQPYFDGIYFIEAEDDDELSLDYAYSLDRYKECILNRILYLSSCNDCLFEKDLDLLNAHSFYLGLEKALELRFIDEILYLVNALNEYCTNDCTTCGKFSNVEDVTSEDILGSSETIIITLDGGAF